MFKTLFNIIINMLATIIQIIVWPVNQIISSALPDLSDKITSVTTVFNSVFNSINWAVSILPDVVIESLLFIISVEIVMLAIHKSTHALTMVWNVLQKIKFW